jgi:hypothetical protein
MYEESFLSNMKTRFNFDTPLREKKALVLHLRRQLTLSFYFYWRNLLILKCYNHRYHRKVSGFSGLVCLSVNLRSVSKSEGL